MQPLDLQGHVVPHFKALRYGKDEKGRLRCRGISTICQGVLKNSNLLHKTGLVDSQMVGTVTDNFKSDKASTDFCISITYLFI